MTLPSEVEGRWVVRPSPRAAHRVIQGQAVVVVIDSRKLHTLNTVGTRVFELLDGRPLEAVADVIADEFEVSRDEAWEDIRSFVAELLDADAVTVDAR